MTRRHCNVGDILVVMIPHPSDGDVLPESVCDKKAKHTIVQKHAEEMNTSKNIYWVCDDHFKIIQDVYKDNMNQAPPSDHAICPACGVVHPDAGLRFRFRKNKV